MLLLCVVQTPKGQQLLSWGKLCQATEGSSGIIRESSGFFSAPHKSNFFFLFFATLVSPYFSDRPFTRSKRQSPEKPNQDYLVQQKYFAAVGAWGMGIVQIKKFTVVIVIITISVFACQLYRFLRSDILMAEHVSKESKVTGRYTGVVVHWKASLGQDEERKPSATPRKKGNVLRHSPPIPRFYS